jgi:squalene-hopene/tetraprenyl-beta-curcumene cyclase
VPGDWAVKRPHVRPGGWPFQYYNDFYPDLDDTAMAVMALHRIERLDPARKRAAIDSGVEWFVGMQGSDGGWASFDADNRRMIFNNIPFADHGALLDPSTEDLTGRGLEMLGLLGHDLTHPAARRGLDFLQRTQSPEGGWYGRWGVNYIYGTWSVLRGLAAIGADIESDWVRRAVRWLLSCQNADGGWGETLTSYDDPELAGRGESIPSQTAWALLALAAAGERDAPAVARGVEYLVATQDADGGWTDPLWNGTGFPRVFYLKYHFYAKYFPLWALGVYRRERT